MNWIDSHCHLTDLRIFDSRKTIIQEAEAQGISFFMLGGVSPDEWSRQFQIAAEYPKKIGLCLGLHPYFAAHHEEEECEAALDLLARKLGELKRRPQSQLESLSGGPLFALGETGLDFRPPYVLGESREKQIRCFEAQIELSQVLSLPLVLHIVQAHEKALTVYDFFGSSKGGGGLVHAFSGSLDIAEQWTRRGFLISVGGSVTYEKNQKLQHAVKHMPLEWLVIESDSPDQKPENWKKSLNEPSSLLDVALKIAQLRGITSQDVFELSRNNFKRVFGSSLN
jgi:TatD DNase family protein